jgi:YHS domain-containing protein
VAYFKENKPVKGDANITYTWKGAEWQFASAANREAFQKNPEKYAPQYGGYCAFGLAGGYKAPTQADAWSIVDGRLYLNYNAEVQKSWSEKKDEFIKKADSNWPEVKKKK